MPTARNQKLDELAWCAAKSRGEEGMAVLISVIALSLFSVMGLYMSLSATTQVRISDNYESRLQADAAARAGLAHARELIPGIDHDDLLRGPDGAFDSSSLYTSTARTHGFRNWLGWSAARAVDLINPTSSVSGLPDDGLMSTGRYGSTSGTPLIPAAGVAFYAPNPYGSGSQLTSRYFVKVTDNNGEPSELAADPANNPFLDGDGIILVRSMGVAGTIRETGTAPGRANSAVVYEARFRRSTTFDLDSPVVLEGDTVLPSSNNMFNGNSFSINGGSNQYGIGRIDTLSTSGSDPVQQITSQLSKNQKDNVTGLGSNPSVTDLTPGLAGDDLKLLDANFLWDFVTQQVPSFADSIFQGDQKWAGANAPDLGAYDLSKPRNDPSQRPRVTYVNGDLEISGNVTGAGLLVTTGSLKGNGAFTFNGVMLVIGEGDANFGGWNVGLEGGIFIVNVQLDQNGTPQFGTTRFTMAGNSNIRTNATALRMATDRIASRQISLREVTSSMDP